MQEHLSISVIIPALNVAPWLPRCLESVLSQRDVSLEVLLIDDGSLDATAEIATGFQAVDPRLRVLRTPRVGAGAARNVGTCKAQGTYLAFVDADDSIPENTYGSLLRVALQTQADVTIGRYLRVVDTVVSEPQPSHFPAPGQLLTLRDFPDLLRQRQCWNRLVRRDFWLEHNLQFSTSRRANDILAMTRMLLTAERVATVDDIVYHYHSRPGDTSITSLQGHVDFFTDYLREEIQCAELCMGTPDRGIKKSYALTVLRRDLPKHLQSLLATYDALDPATSGALQNDLSLFLSLVADAPMARPAAACAFAVETASNGQWSTCQRIIADLWNQEPAEPSVYASGLCSCQDSPHLHPWVYTHIFTEKVLRRLATLPSESLATEVRDHAQVYQLCLQNYSSSLDLDDGEKRVLAEIRKVGTSSEPA